MRRTQRTRSEPTLHVRGARRRRRLSLWRPRPGSRWPSILQTSYRPDREYIDGELRERHVGKWEHSRLQWLLAVWFGTREQEWGITGSIEQRTSVAGKRVRIPDLVLLKAGPQPSIITAPLLLAIEILSPDDTYSDTEDRAADYQRMGVETIWIIDPGTRTGRVCIGSAWTSAERLEVPGTPIYVELAEIFDRIQPATALTEPSD